VDHLQSFRPRDGLLCQTAVYLTHSNGLTIVLRWSCWVSTVEHEVDPKFTLSTGCSGNSVCRKKSFLTMTFYAIFGGRKSNGLSLHTEHIIVNKSWWDWINLSADCSADRLMNDAVRIKLRAALHLEMGKNPNPARTNQARTQVLSRTEPNQTRRLKHARTRTEPNSHTP